MENIRYWDKELPVVKIMGRTRIAHYPKAGVLQFSVLHQNPDGSLEIGKTVCLYEDSITRDNLPAIEYLMDVLHMWRKRGRMLNPNDRQRKNIALADLQALVSAEQIDQGNFITEPAGDPVGVDTLQDQAGPVAEVAGLEKPITETRPAPLAALESAGAAISNQETGGINHDDQRD